MVISVGYWRQGYPIQKYLFPDTNKPPISVQRDSRVKRSLSVPPKNVTPHHPPSNLIPPPQKVSKGYDMMDPIKR